MTFICNYSIGSIVNILTCDTRQIATVFGKEIVINDSSTKIHQITDRAFCVSGGLVSITDYIIKKLKEKCSSESNEFDIEEKIREIDVDVQKKFCHEFKEDEHAQVIISGFSALGTTFTVNYNPNQRDEEERIFLVKKHYGNIFISGAVPEGFEDVFQTILAARDHIHNEMTHVEMTQILLEAIAAVQQEMFIAAPGKVSEWLCYTAMVWDKDHSVPIVISDKMNLEPKSIEGVTE